MSARRVTAVTAIPVARGCERLRPVPEILGDTAQTIKQVGNGNREPFLDLLPHEIVLGVHRRRDALVKKLRFRRGTWRKLLVQLCESIDECFDPLDGFPALLAPVLQPKGERAAGKGRAQRGPPAMVTGTAEKAPGCLRCASSTRAWGTDSPRRRRCRRYRVGKAHALL